MPEIRPLERSETQDLLELLDGWELGDGWRGRDFFRRYLEDDPTFETRNVWVARDGQQVVACAQVFPRTVRTRLGEQPIAGIGSVFTHREHRGRGIATSVLAATVADLRRRGFVLGLLFADRVQWYRHLGWLPWCSVGIRLTPPAQSPRVGVAADAEIQPMQPERDLADVAALHAAYSRPLLGTLVRDARLWQTSLRCAGNPDETFLVARRGGRLLAYVRAIVLEGRTTLSEWGVLAAQEVTLVALVDRIARDLRPAPCLHLPRAVDPALDAALVRAGYAIHAEDRLTAMMRPIETEERSSAPPDELLERYLPRDRFVFWPSDRF